MNRSTLQITLILFFSFFSFSILSGQNFPGFEIEMSKKSIHKAHVEKLVSIDSNKVFALRKTHNNWSKVQTAFTNMPKKVFIESFDTRTLKSKKKVKVKMNYQGKSTRPFDLITMNQELYLLSTSYKRMKGMIYLLAQKVNQSTLIPSKEHINLGQIKSFPLDEGTFELVYSPDKSKMAIFAHTIRAKKKAYSITVVDSDLNKLWAVDQSYSQVEVFNQCSLNNDGT